MPTTEVRLVEAVVALEPAIRARLSKILIEQRAEQTTARLMVLLYDQTARPTPGRSFALTLGDPPGSSELAVWSTGPVTRVLTRAVGVEEQIEELGASGLVGRLEAASVVPLVVRGGRSVPDPDRRAWEITTHAGSATERAAWLATLRATPPG